MRTVDPELWYKSVKHPSLQGTRRATFGQKRTNSWESHVRDSFMDSMREFWEHSSFVGIKYYNIDDIEDWTRYVSLGVLLTSVVLGLLALYVDISDIRASPPLLISQLSDANSADQMQFPAVALCSNNLISQHKLDSYTLLLLTHPVNDRYQFSASAIRSNLVAFGALLTRGVPQFHGDFMRFLLDVDPRFNVSHLMLQLSPACSSILVRCSWRGDVLPCGQLFAARVTQLGYCCVFNSRYQPEDYDTPSKVLDLVGQDFGLGVVIQENSSDVALSRRPRQGLEMVLFDSAEYPLLHGGAARLVPVPTRAALFVALTARHQRAHDDVRYISEAWRGCRLAAPRGSYSWCLAECLRDTVAALCGCAPLGVAPPSLRSAVPACNLTELACLDKHGEQFKYLYPRGSEHPQLREEAQSSLECERCAPDCGRLVHGAETFHCRRRRNILQNFLTAGMVLGNASVVRLFYGSEHQRLLAVEPATRWYEAAAWYSCRLVLVPGVSLACLLELVFHCACRWPHHYKRRTHLATHH